MQWQHVLTGKAKYASRWFRYPSKSIRQREADRLDALDPLEALDRVVKA